MHNISPEARQKHRIYVRYIVMGLLAAFTCSYAGDSQNGGTGGKNSVLHENPSFLKFTAQLGGQSPGTESLPDAKTGEDIVRDWFDESSAGLEHLSTQPTALVKSTPRARDVLKSPDITDVLENSGSGTNNEATAEAVQLRVAGYFSSESNYGLEPGSTDQSLAAAALNLDGDTVTRPIVAPYVRPPNTNAQTAYAAPSPPDQITDAAVEKRPAPPRSTAKPRKSQIQQDADELAKELGLSDTNAPAPDTGKRKSTVLHDDAAALAKELGIADTTSRKATNWAQEAQDAEASTNAWEQQQAILAEQRRQAQIAEQQRQAQLAEQQRQARLAEQQRQAQLLAQQRAQQERQQQEEQRQAAMEAANTQPQESSSGLYSFLKNTVTVLGAAQQLKSVIDGGATAGSASSLSSAVSGLGSASGAGGDCTPPAVQAIVNQCTASSSGLGICQTARLFASCMARIEPACGGCNSCILNARAYRRSGETTAAQACVGGK